MTHAAPAKSFLLKVLKASSLLALKARAEYQLLSQYFHAYSSYCYLGTFLGFGFFKGLFLSPQSGSQLL
jgi:hypothetical protein